MLRTLLILGIVFIHVPSPPIGAEPGPSFTLLNSLLSGTLLLGAVPALSMISGYLLFVRQPPVPYLGVLRRKAGRLLVPLVLWSAPFALLLAVVQYMGLSTHAFRFTLAASTPGDLADMVFALRQPPVNPPLYFLRDLFVCFALSPLLRVGLSRIPWLAFCVLAIAVVASPPFSLLLRYDILLGFYLGGLVATGHLSLDALSRLRWGPIVAYCGVGITLVFGPLVPFPLSPAIPPDVLQDAGYFLIRLAGPVAFWALAGLLLRRTPRPVWDWTARRSYFVFLGHAPLLMLMWLLLGGSMPYPVFYVLAPLATVIILVALYGGIGRFSPALLRLLTGRHQAHHPRIAVPGAFAGG